MKIRAVTWVFLFAVLGVLACGCSGGNSPVVNGADQEDPETPREVLSSFAEACENKDVETACDLLLNPARWRKSMEMAEDVLPHFGEACRNAQEVRRERDCYRYRMRIRHPDDPHNRVMENNIYVVRIRDLDGRAGRWGVDFVYTGDGRAEIERKRRRMEQTALLPEERNGQWGTMYTHASILTRAILAYYFLMYPQDDRFISDMNGFLNPELFNYDVLVTHPGDIESILGIGYDSYDSMPPDAVLVMNFMCALMQAGSADEDVFCGELNADGSVNFFRDVELQYDGTILFNTPGGFGGDDDTFLKGFGHFLTPETQSAWEIDFVRFNDLELLGGVGDASVGALDWAMGNGVMGPYDILGIVDMRAARNRKTFYRAVNLVEQFKNEWNPFEAAEKLANAFYTFGYTLHLLEDCGCPAHARNDMHGVPIISSIPGLGSLQPDPIEDWGETLKQSFVDETILMYKDLVTEADPITRTTSGFPGEQILQNLYTNAEYTDYPGVEALFEYTALIANRMCFSEDTIYRSTNSSAANTNYYPHLTDLDLDFFGKSVVYGSPGYPISNDEYLAARGNAMFDVWRSWFWTTHWFQDPEIDDVEDALYNGWDILTVADDDDEDYYANSTLGVREQQWRLLFPLIVKTGAAYLHEFYIACYGFPG